MTRTLLSTVAFILIVVGTNEAQHLRDSPAVQDVYRLYRAAGIAAPSIRFPVGDREVAAWAADIAARADDPDITTEARELQRRVAPPEDTMTIGANVTTTVMGTTENLGALLDEEYGRVYSLQHPFFELGMFLDHPSGVRLSIREERQRELRRAAYWNTPLFPEGKPFATENNSIREGTISAYLGPLQFQFGRQKLAMGPSPVTSLIINPDIPFLDGLRIAGRFGRLTMTSMTASLENRNAMGDVTVQAESPELYQLGRNQIYFNIHYFEYQFGRVRTGIGSSVVLAREMNEFHLTDFFPVASWHNANIVPNNHSLFADASIVPVPGLEVYAAVGLDDVNGEAVGVSDSDVPTIPAVTVGVTGEYRPGRGETAIRYVAESGSTHYLWGSFNDGLELSRGIYRMDLFGENRWMPLTSRYGPGTTWGILEADIHHPITDSLTITAGVSLELWERIDGIGLTETPYAAIPDIDSRDRTPRARIEFPISVSFGDRAALRLTPVLTGTGGNLQPELRGTATVTFRGRYTEKVD